VFRGTEKLDQLFGRGVAFQVLLWSRTGMKLEGCRVPIGGQAGGREGRMRPWGLSCTPAAMRLLEEYDWPGNVRELRNVVRRIVLLGRGEVLAADVQSVLEEWPRVSEVQSRLRTLAEKLAEVERREVWGLF